MSWLPKREKLDPKQASAFDFTVAQARNFHVSGEAGTGKDAVQVHGRGKMTRGDSNGRLVDMA